MTVPRLPYALLACMLWAVLPQTGRAQSAAAPSAGTAPATAAATTATASEERVKAASLYKFLGYTEWPKAAFARPDAPYVIAVTGAEDIAEDLDRLVAGRRVNDRPVAVRRVRPNESLSGVHMLFIGKGERGRQAQLVRQLQGQPVLIVTENDTGPVPGSMINFRIADERVRFEVALEPVEKAGLRVDARMLAVALVVHKGAIL